MNRESTLLSRGSYEIYGTLRREEYDVAIGLIRMALMNVLPAVVTDVRFNPSFLLDLQEHFRTMRR